MKLLLIFLGLVSVAFAQPPSPYGLRIYNGAEAKPGQIPYQVSLRNVYNEHQCGAAILTDRWVITANHCITIDDPILTISVGSVNVSLGDIYAIKQIVWYTKKDNEFIDNDVVLLKIEQSIQFNDFVQPIRIRKTPVGSGEIGVVSGWGDLSVDGQEDYPEMLQFVELTTMSDEECKIKFNVTEEIYDDNLCTFQLNRGACYGDSGGPFTVNGELVGLVSKGVNDRCDSGDVFVRVSYYADWINEIVNGK